MFWCHQLNLPFLKLLTRRVVRKLLWPAPQNCWWKQTKYLSKRRKVCRIIIKWTSRKIWKWQVWKVWIEVITKSRDVALLSESFGTLLKSSELEFLNNFDLFYQIITQKYFTKNIYEKIRYVLVDAEIILKNFNF